MPDSFPVLVYLHGFNSSPKALKAYQLQAYLHKKRLPFDYLRPAIPDTPDQAMVFLQNMMTELEDRPVWLFGSSLGGFYATWLAENRARTKAVLINPAVRPHELMHHHLGEQRNPYTDHCYRLTQEHMQALQSWHVNRIKHPERFLLLLQMADEVLDAAEASRHFYQSRCMIEPGGNHRFAGLYRYFPDIFSWLVWE